MITDFLKLLEREINLSIKNHSVLFSFSVFFVISLLIFVFAFGPNLDDIPNLYTPVVWVVLLFSIMLISDNFIHNDYLDGSLKELQFLGYNEELILSCKSIVMWGIIILPTLFLIPICSLFLNFKLLDLPNLLINILLASPSLILIALVSSLFSIQLKRNRILQFVIIFPFFVPIIIFSTSINNSQNNSFLILIGIFLVTLPVSLTAGRLIMKEINK
jgi:heme exporter protein B